MPREERLPYVPFPTEKPGQIATPSIHEDFPQVHLTNAVETAFQALGRGYGTLGNAYSAVGESWGKLGSTFRNAGNELWDRAVAIKELENDKVVDDATLKYHNVNSDTVDDFKGKLGESTGGSAGLKAAIKKTEDDRQAIENTLNPEQAKRFRAETRGYQGNAVRQLTQHAADQFRTTQRKSAEAMADLYRDQAVTADNEGDYQAAIEGIRRVVTGKLKETAGYSVEQTEEELHKRIGEAIAHKADKVADDGDPSRALQMIVDAGKKGQITGPIYDHYYKTISEKQKGNEARNISDQVVYKDTDRHWSDIQAEAEKLAETLRSGDSEFKEKVVREARAKYSSLQLQRREQVQQNKDTVIDAIMGYSNPEGKLPRTREELQVNPQVWAAYWDLPDTERRKMDAALLQNAKEDYRPTPETDRIFDKLWGISQVDPYRFKDMDFYDAHIPKADRDKLRALQRDISKKGVKAIEDPKVKEAWGILSREGNVPPEVLANKDLRAEYMGRLRQAMVGAAGAEGRTGPLKPEEIKAIGRQLIKQESTGWFFGYPRSYLWEELKNVPDDFRKDILEGFPGLSEEQIIDAYSRKVFREEFKKLHSGKQVAPTTTNLPRMP